MNFPDWLEKHREKFVTYTSQEIADLAIVCGFDRVEVSHWLATTDRRAA